ncbi:MAG: DsrE family protein [Sporocytophaga sp.]|uniref:DsrE family protein n=1 Tax=Sporocytophaga sp. TaxID=2231183 RepID=UPI001B1D4F02|nr:DsrE family protein [Sporocytophaga sp.]MBO9701050.1 DsrE family protein [Sporocytophaga sp.]
MNLQDKNKVKTIVLNVLISISLLHTSFIYRPIHESTILSDKKKLNYAILISQPNHIKAVVNTAESITKDSKYRRETLVVMACAKSVEAFVKGSEFAELIQKGKAAGIQFKICGMSLQQFNIDPLTIMNGIEIVPNGLTYMFDLQMNGYKTVEL